MSLRPHHATPCILSLITLSTLGTLSNHAAAQPYNFSEVTTICQDAIAGTNVAQPVPGFDFLLMKNGEVVYHRAFGLWSRNRVANADSATKTLSGALILSIAENSQRPFSLNTRLSDYIPAFRGDKASINIRQCFSHTSGLAESNAISSQNLTLQQAAIAIAGLPLAYAPASGFFYGGTSMHAAGAAAELAVGTSWNNAFLSRIAGPLNLTNTRFVISSPTNPRIAGGCQSNAIEFASFMEALRNNGEFNGTRILSPQSVATMFTRQSPLGVPVISSPLQGGSDYGVGVWLDQRNQSGELIGAIAAGARGFACWIDFDDEMVGCFATDTTLSPNVQPVYSLLRNAAQAAIRAGCRADFNQDGGIDGEDVTVFFDAWTEGFRNADINRDGGVDGSDVERFFDLWTAADC